MIKGIGVDIESIERFKDLGPEFLDLVYSAREIEYCKKKKEFYICLAGKFCAKEAVVKSFDREISMKDVEIINDEGGMPQVYIRGELKENVKCSISHTEEHAIAYVINEVQEDG